MKRSLLGVMAGLSLLILVTLFGRAVKAANNNICIADGVGRENVITDKVREESLKLSNFLTPVFSSNDKVSAIFQSKLMIRKIQ